MLESVVRRCSDCGVTIDPEARVTRMIRDVDFWEGGSVDPARTWREVQYAHEGHEAWYLDRGYRVAESGVLGDLTARSGKP